MKATADERLKIDERPHMLLDVGHLQNLWVDFRSQDAICLSPATSNMAMNFSKTSSAISKALNDSFDWNPTTSSQLQLRNKLDYNDRMLAFCIRIIRTLTILAFRRIFLWTNDLSDVESDNYSLVAKILTNCQIDQAS